MMIFLKNSFKLQQRTSIVLLRLPYKAKFAELTSEYVLIINTIYFSLKTKEKFCMVPTVVGQTSLAPAQKVMETDPA